MGVDRREDIARLAVNQNWGLLELRPMRMSLEDIFLQLTTQDEEEEAYEDEEEYEDEEGEEEEEEGDKGAKGN
jgi:ABC-2 type transport system ATP-binding protein